MKRLKLTRSTLALLAILLGFFIYFAARVFLLVKYHEIFSILGFREVLSAFLNGFRFDAAVMLIYVGPVALMLLLPVKFALWRWFWLAALTLMYLATALILTVDTYFFGYVGRHFADELYYLGNEGGFVAGMAGVYAIPIIIFSIVLGAIVFIMSRLALAEVKPERLIPVKILILIAICFIGIRGTFASKPLSTIDAYNEGIVKGNLTMNGVYSSYRYGKKSNRKELMPLDEALTTLNLDPSKQYPLMKYYEGNAKPKNIVVLIMESWSWYYMGLNGNTPASLTPNFDRLAEQGALFTRHYTPYNRSVNGIQAIITGIVPLQELPSLGFGLEVKTTGSMRQLSKSGYHTLFLQTSNRRSMYMDGIASALGFEEYYGMEDYPLLLDYPNPEAAAYGWDYDGFMYFFDKINNIPQQKNFFAVYFSGTTHTPYSPLPPQFMQAGADSGNEAGFMSTLSYADWSLGEFMKAAEKEDWFADTIFVITADHGLGEFEPNDIFMVKYHIPLLIYAPGLIEPMVYDNISSHVDILPTVLPYMNLNGSMPIMGRDLSGNEEGRAYVNEGNLSTFLTDSAWVKMSENIVLESSLPEGAERDRLAHWLEAYQEVVYKLVNDGRWSPPI